MTAITREFSPVDHVLLCSVLSAGSWCSFEQMDSGLAIGSGLPHSVRHLPLFFHPHRIQRLRLRQPTHVPRHPLTSPASASSSSSSSSQLWRNLHLLSSFQALLNKALICFSWLGWRVEVSTVLLRYKTDEGEEVWHRLSTWKEALKGIFSSTGSVGYKWWLEWIQLSLAPTVLQKLLLSPDWQKERNHSDFSWIFRYSIWMKAHKVF